jgi:hypothetical protein
VNDFRAVLDEEIGEPPRSTVDVESVVAGQRRRLALRRAGGAVTAGALAVAVTFAGSALLVRPGGGIPASAPAPACGPVAAGPTPGPSPWIQPGATPTGDPAPADPALPIGAEDRLTTALSAAVAIEIGAARLAPEPVDGAAHPPLSFFGGPCDRHDSGSYLATASIRSAAGTPLGRLLVYVQTSTDTGCTPTGSGAGCTVSRGPHGETIRAKTDTGDLQGEVKTEAMVVVSKPDGTVLQLIADGPAGTGRPAPLDVPALTRIGLVPGLSLTR